MEDFEGPLVAARGIRKHYGGITALDDVSLEVLPAEIHALVGENGAGKSTLVKIMTGAADPDAGERRILGGPSRHLTPERAREHGDRRRLPGAEPRPGADRAREHVPRPRARTAPGVLARKADANAQAREALDRVGVARPARHATSRALSVAERQLVEIARALVYEAKVLIFDEPSAILSGRRARPGLRGHRGAAGGRPRHPLHLPPPRRDLPARRPRDGAQGRPRRDDPRRRRAHDRRADPADGRPRHRRAAAAEAADRPGRARGTRRSSCAPDSEPGQLRAATRARCSASRASSARAARASRGALGRHPAARGRARSSGTAAPSGSSGRATPSAQGSSSSRRTGRAKG